MTSMFVLAASFGKPPKVFSSKELAAKELILTFVSSLPHRVFDKDNAEWKEVIDISQDVDYATAYDKMVSLGLNIDDKVPYGNYVFIEEVVVDAAEFNESDVDFTGRQADFDTTYYSSFSSNTTYELSNDVGFGNIKVSGKKIIVSDPATRASDKRKGMRLTVDDVEKGHWNVLSDVLFLETTTTSTTKDGRSTTHVVKQSAPMCLVLQSAKMTASTKTTKENFQVIVDSGMMGIGCAKQWKNNPTSELENKVRGQVTPYDEIGKITHNTTEPSVGWYKEFLAVSTTTYGDGNYDVEVLRDTSTGKVVEVRVWFERDHESYISKLKHLKNIARKA